jgi:hypothetical protein
MERESQLLGDDEDWQDDRAVPPEELDAVRQVHVESPSDPLR